MSDDAVARLLRSEHPLVCIEAPAGCGKTFQGAQYARDAVGKIKRGRLLVLTHTHAACGVFAERTRGVGSSAEIRTIDALVAQIAKAYHKSLNLPSDVASWAWRDGAGFDAMAAKAAAFLKIQPMVARALPQRYPIIICDEHQDSSDDQRSIIMALYKAGSKLRIFSDPLQRIYGDHSNRAALVEREKWRALTETAAFEKLNYPHRWRDGCPDLGEWVLLARKRLENEEPVDLTGKLPASLRILVGDNISPKATGYQLSRDHRRPLDRVVQAADQIMVLAPHNDFVTALRPFWNRSIPVWEGHTRNALATLVGVLREGSGDAYVLAQGLIAFVGETAVGFGKSSHGDRLLQEVQEGCVRATRGKPAKIQAIAQRILDDPTHAGVASALDLIRELAEKKQAGFDAVKIDHRNEFRDAIRLGKFSDPDEAFAEIARRRSYAMPVPPPRVLSTIHKAKGLECDNALIMGCDKRCFTRTRYARCRLYVALSRAKKTLTLVLSDADPSPLFKIT